MYIEQKFDWMRKVFVAKLEDLSSVPRTHIVEGENQLLLKVVFFLLVLEAEKSGTTGWCVVRAFLLHYPRTKRAEGRVCLREGGTAP